MKPLFFIVALLSFALVTFAAPDIDMVHVKGSCYKMGDIFGNGLGNEKPAHNVCVSDFSISKFLVTQSEWQAVMGTNPSKVIGERLPVENVSWNDAQQFIAKLNHLTGRHYRLPTEAEWEFAARSGGKQEKWAGTNSESELSEFAWQKSNSGGKTHEIGQKRPNGLGLYDMSGNVWEWCQDWYGDDYYGKSPKENPQGPMTGFYRVLRGGSWSDSPGNIRASFRSHDSPTFGFFIFGFRLVLPVVQ